MSRKEYYNYFNDNDRRYMETRIPKKRAERFGHMSIIISLTFGLGAAIVYAQFVESILGKKMLFFGNLSIFVVLFLATFIGYDFSVLLAWLLGLINRRERQLLFKMYSPDSMFEEPDDCEKNS